MTDITVALTPVPPVNVQVGVAALNVQFSSQGLAGPAGIQGSQGVPGPIGPVGPAPLVETYIFTQSQPASTWVIAHNLGRYPSVDVADSTGREEIGEVQYVDGNNLNLFFSAPFSGEAYLN